MPWMQVKGFQSFITLFFFTTTFENLHLGLALHPECQLLYFGALIATTYYKGKGYLLINELCISALIITINKWEYIWQGEKRKFRMSYPYILSWWYAHSRILTNICWNKDWILCFEWKLQSKFTLGKQFMVRIKSTAHKDSTNNIIVSSPCTRLLPNPRYCFFFFCIAICQ